MSERPPIDQDDMDKPVKSRELPPLELFPSREWLFGWIDDVEYRYAMFKGQQQYLTNKEDEQILDEETGEPIPIKEFNITILVKDWNLPNGDPRKVWVSLSSSMGGRAHLPNVLNKFASKEENPTPAEIINLFMANKHVRFQVSNKKSQDNDKTYQNVIWDSLEPTDPTGAPVQWDE